MCQVQSQYWFIGHEPCLDAGISVDQCCCLLTYWHSELKRLDMVMCKVDYY